MDLAGKPFYLEPSQEKWVEETLAGMTVEEKVGQLFCISMDVGDREKLSETVGAFQPGGFMFRPAPAADIKSASELIRARLRIPPLLAANLESGGNGLYQEGTFFARNMQAAATDEDEQAFRQGFVCGTEAAAFKVNWAFAPVVDIDLNWRNPITNVRTYGSDPDRVARMGKAYMDGIRQADPGMAVCIKHFPGDGVDERDQHLLPSVNSLSCEEWEQTYGKVYRRLIDEGAETLMVGHILQPALTARYCPEIRPDQVLPASLSRCLVGEFIRNELKFNGLIVTDSSNMVGYTALMSRKKALARSIMAGVDMLLFCKDMEEDRRSVLEAVQTGEITPERLDEAVTRQLALKARLLSKSPEAPPEVPVGLFDDWAAECADKAVTLVKDNQGLLPISPEKTRRVRLTVLGERNTGGSFGDTESVTEPLRRELERCGFEVSVYDYETLEHREIVDNGVGKLKEKFDLSIVAANIPTGSNNTSRRIDWIPMLAADCPWYVKDIPTMFVSFCNPYHMVDVPFISTFINAYSANRSCVRACVEKMTGRSPFKGRSPVDVWCGTWGAKEY